MFALLSADFTRRNILPPEYWTNFEGAVDAMCSAVREGYEKYYAKDIESGKEPSFDDLFFNMENGTIEDRDDFGIDINEGTAWSNIDDDKERAWQIVAVPDNFVCVMPDGTHVALDPESEDDNSVAGIARKLKELTDRGYGDMAVVYRDDETDPDPDIYAVYVDEDADCVVMSGNPFGNQDILSCDKEEDAVLIVQNGLKFSLTKEQMYAAYLQQKHLFNLETATEQFYNLALGVDDPDCLSVEELDEAIAEFEQDYNVHYEFASSATMMEQYLKTFANLRFDNEGSVAEDVLWTTAIQDVLEQHKQEMTIDDVVRWLNAGYTGWNDQDKAICKKFLLEYQAANQLSLNELAKLCRTEKEWFLNEIWG